VFGLAIRAMFPMRSGRNITKALRRSGLDGPFSGARFAPSSTVTLLQSSPTLESVFAAQRMRVIQIGGRLTF